jgi:hypothetical protein
MAVSPPFSDVAWVRRDLPSVESEDYSNTQIERAIEDGDKEVVDDLNNYVDWSLLDTVPEAVKRLSHYKACELVLLRVINNAAAISDENSLVNYWHNHYERLLKDIRAQAVRLLDDSHEEINPDEHTKRDVRIGRII